MNVSRWVLGNCDGVICRHLIDLPRSIDRVIIVVSMLSCDFKKKKKLRMLYDTKRDQMGVLGLTWDCDEFLDSKKPINLSCLSC